jgi:hypothetical protein
VSTRSATNGHARLPRLRRQRPSCAKPGPTALSAVDGCGVRLDRAFDIRTALLALLTGFVSGPPISGVVLGYSVGTGWCL